ncbi:TetR/AcrR family transcriptional regulator [Veronia pacifica]|uniref:Transcriptional regulator n=1 Tax=Veronia pacifica TaxID=1080227 RepID=A0A1C3EIE2_9GAMM|nr:TetR/AcrR family transcriptional regulator [Veronia pacifica]ODA33005.1 transcriptional regulator [Veronia pacifica]
MSKQQETRNRILEAGFDIASNNGLESLTIGELAKQVEMSKSGLFSHFNSRANLQAAVVNFAAEKFEERIVVPCQKLTYLSVEQKLRDLIKNWLDWNGSFQGSCLFLDAWRENSQPDDVVQAALKGVTSRWLEYLHYQFNKGASQGEFVNELDGWQKVYELYGLYLSSHLFNNLTLAGSSRDRFWQGIDALFESCRADR